MFKKKTQNNLKCNSLNFVKISQDGIGRMSRDSSIPYKGLCIDGVKTCTGIIIVGSQKISTIHKSFGSSWKDIENEFTKVGKLEKWYVAYNKKTSHPAAQTIRKNNKQKFLKFKEKYGNYEQLSIPNASLIITKEGKIITPDSELFGIMPPDAPLRLLINFFNTYFQKTHTAHLDFQFDDKWLPLPKLASKANNIVNTCIKEKYFTKSQIQKYITSEVSEFRNQYLKNQHKPHFFYETLLSQSDPKSVINEISIGIENYLKAKKIYSNHKFHSSCKLIDKLNSITKIPFSTLNKSGIEIINATCFTNVVYDARKIKQQLEKLNIPCSLAKINLHTFEETIYEVRIKNITDTKLSNKIEELYTNLMKKIKVIHFSNKK